MSSRRPLHFVHLKIRGFTLLETLVVMALLSIIVLAMVSSLRSVGQGSDKVEERLRRLDDYRIATRFVRSALGRVSARAVINPRGAGPLFEGASDHVAWVGVMPARYGAGGRYFFRLGIEDVEGIASLVLRYVQWVDQAEFPDWAGAARQVIATGVRGLALRYEDPRQLDTSLAWSDAWVPVNELPSKVSILMEGERLLMDRMVIPIRVLPASDPRYGHGGDGTVVGGQS